MREHAGLVGGSGPSLGDLVAGISVALVLIPQSLAYAELAGLPPAIGLFAAALPPLLAARFVSCPWLQTGPVALTALLTFGALSPLSAPGSSEYVALATQLAVVVGVTRGLLGALRLGRVAYVLSEPVVVGFTSAAAIVIACSQLPKMLGAESGDSDNVIVNAISALIDPGAWSGEAIAISLATLGIVAAGRRIHTLFPGILLAVVVTTLWSAASGYGGAVVGELPGQLPSLAFPNLSGIGQVLLPGVVIAFVGFAEPASIARTLCRTEQRSWSPSRELIGSCVANLSSAVSGGFPVGGSFSRSSVNHLAGGTSWWSGAITGAIVLLLLPTSPVLADLPTATLGAIILSAVYRLVRPREIAAILGRTPVEGAIAIVTVVATLALAPRIDRAILLGVGLSLTATAVAAVREGRVSSLAGPGLGAERSGDEVTLSPSGSIWFFVAPTFSDRCRDELADHRDARKVAIDLDGVTALDHTGAGAIRMVADDARSAGHIVTITGGSKADRALVAAR